MSLYTPKIGTSYSPIILIVFVMFFVLAVLIALGIAQYHFSKIKNKSPGLIIPIVFSFLGLTANIVISFVLSIAMYAVRTFCIFLIPFQIPAIIYFIIYLAVRSSMPKNDTANCEKEMQKMSIQDL